VKGHVSSTSAAHRGFFFITGEDGLSYFCHVKELKGRSIETVQEKMRVVFDPGLGPKGLYATKVTFPVLDMDDAFGNVL
jgi:cold shock CspA family protein